MRIEVVTLFPALIEQGLGYGVLARTLRRGLMQVSTEDPRAHATDAHRSVDDRPYGGGPGMVLKPEPLCAAIEAARLRLPAAAPCIALSAQGEPLRQQHVARLAGLPGLVLVAGRYEGIDERVFELAVDLQLSIGDYVVSGGELPALLLIDAIARLLPGALGDERSSAEESFAAQHAGALLDWPHYTRPPSYAGHGVPAVLGSGDHAAIERWRLKQALGRTWLRRPELIERSALDSVRAGLLHEFLSELSEPRGEKERA